MQRERLQRELEEKKKKVGGSWTVQLPQSVELGRTFSGLLAQVGITQHTQTQIQRHTHAQTQ